MVYDDNTINVEFIDAEGSARILDAPTDGVNFVVVWHQDAASYGDEMLMDSDGPWVLSTGRLYEVAKFLHDKRLGAEKKYGQYYCPTHVVLEDGLSLSDERQALLIEYVNDLYTEYNQTKKDEIAELKRLREKYPKV